ncbi:MAG: alpha/beta hydrolase [Nakamurella sp.]
MRRFIAILITALVAALLVVAQPAQAGAPPTAPATSEYQPPAIDWGACINPTLARFGAQCGFVIVPLNYQDPAGATIQIAVSRVQHSVPDDQYQGIMLVNPGGPGGSGLIYSTLGGAIPNGAGASYDWIGFDPRGVGASVPSLSCDGNYFSNPRPQYIPYTASLQKTWLDRSKGYAQACTAAGGELLEHLKTTDSVRDMDSIRAALGERQLNFYGFSYGTYLAQVYSTLYPERVRRMVLDGVVNSSRVWYQANLDQDVAFDRNMDVYFKWLAKYDEVYGLGTDWREIKLDYYVQYAKLSANPAGGFGPDELNDVMLSAGYYVYDWAALGEAFSKLVNDGDYEPLLARYEGGNPQGPGADNGFAVYLATQCTDVQWPQKWSTWQRDNWTTFARAPFLTWNNAWYNAPCLYWSAPAGSPVRVNGAAAPPILLISETKDAATPYSGAIKTRQLFPQSVLIEGVGGTTHSGSLSGVSCTDDKIADYLATGALPTRVSGNRSDVQCDPVPPPDPATAAALSAASTPEADILTQLHEQLAGR